MKKIYMLFLLALVISACQKSSMTAETTMLSSQMSFNVLAPGVQTKVADNAFEASDVIGLYVVDYADSQTPMPLQISGNRANNLPVAFNGAEWVPEKIIYWGDGKSDVYAYYPHIDDVNDVESQYFEVSTEQDEHGSEGSDFLWAKAEGVSRSDGAVDLQMSHIMSKLTVRIVAGEDYIGSLPDDASVRLHNTVTGSRVDLSVGAVSKDLYSTVQSIDMKKLGLRKCDGVEAVTFEAIVVPQMLERVVPLIEINSKSVSYLIEDSFNFRPGIAYTYTATLNASTTAIKVEIGCEIEDWNNPEGGDSGEDEEGGGDSGDSGDDAVYTDLSAAGTANCYLVQQAGDYKFKAVIGNADATVGNVKTVEVLWESFGTDEMPDVGDLIAAASYKDGYICFSTPGTFRDGNAVIAAKNSKGTILWSWHIWCAEDGWQEQVYYNDAGIMMDRNLGATSATPGHVGALGLLYQWGRKDPFLGSASVSSYQPALSTGTWTNSSGGSDILADTDPMTYYSELSMETKSWRTEKSVWDPCPAGWRVPDGGERGVWAVAMGQKAGDNYSSSETEGGLNFSGVMGSDEMIYYPHTGYLCSLDDLYGLGNDSYYWSSSLENALQLNMSYVAPSGLLGPSYGCPVRCQKI